MAALVTTVVAPVSGCTLSSPVVRGGPTAPPPAPVPPVVPGAAEGRATETGLATLAQASARGDEAERWRRLAAVHTEHARVLSWPEPGGPAPTAAPTNEPAVPPSVGDDWEDVADGAAKTHAAAARAASGTLALVWASLAAFVTTAPDARAVAEPRPRPDPPAPAQDAAAMADVVTALHQAVYGYELALVPLTGGSDEDDRVRARLVALLQTRDDVTAVLTDRGQPVPAPEPAYDVAVPGDAAASVALRREIESGLVPWLGRWVMASGDAERPAAVTALTSGTRAAAAVGVPLDAWPGW